MTHQSLNSPDFTSNCGSKSSLKWFGRNLILGEARISRHCRNAKRFAAVFWAFQLVLINLPAQSANPEITSISPVTDQGNPTIIINGSNFGTLPAADLSTQTTT